MKENSTYTTLLEKYLDGTTTTREEEALLSALASRPADSLTPSERAILVMLGGASTARATHSRAASPLVQEPVRPSRSKVWWLTIGSVAAAAVLTLFVKPWTQGGSALSISEPDYQAGKVIETEDEAILLAEELLSEVVYDPTEGIEW